MPQATEPITSFSGFGVGRKVVSETGTSGEYFYSQNMAMSDNGFAPAWVCNTQTDNATLPNLHTIQWFSQGKVGGTLTMFGIDNANTVFRSVSPDVWTQMYRPISTGFGNGLIVDQTQRLLVATDRYLLKYDGTTDYTDGTVTATNGSTSVIGSGTTFIGGMVGKRLQISGDPTVYTIAGVAGSSALSLSTPYAGTTTSGSAYTIYTSWTEQWKDFGSAYDLVVPRPMDIYEDWVVIGNANAVALLNVTDDSFNNIGLNLPTGYNVQCLRAGQNGILIGVNVNNRGAILLWDAYSDRSISPWIWFNSNVRAVIPCSQGWYVITNRGIYLTNGYSQTPLYEYMPDDPLINGGMFSGLIPQGIELVGKYLIFLAGGSVNRQQAGIYLFNLETNLFEFCKVSTKATYGVGPGAIFYDSSFKTHVGFETTGPSSTTYTIGKLLNGYPTVSYFITEPKGSGNSQKAAIRAKLTLDPYVREIGALAFNYTVSCKISNSRRGLWNYATTSSASSTTTTVNVNGTLFSGYEPGDEVTVMNGVNSGQIRHISAITGLGTASEQWTLDSALASNLESGVQLSVTPFKKVAALQFTNQSSLKPLYFNIKNRILGKKFYLKFTFESAGTAPIEVVDGEFTYDDLGESST